MPIRKDTVEIEGNATIPNENGRGVLGNLEYKQCFDKGDNVLPTKGKIIFNGVEYKVTHEKRKGNIVILNQERAIGRLGYVLDFYPESRLSSSAYLEIENERKRTEMIHHFVNGVYDYTHLFSDSPYFQQIKIPGVSLCTTATVQDWNEIHRLHREQNYEEERWKESENKHKDEIFNPVSIRFVSLPKNEEIWDELRNSRNDPLIMLLLGNNLD